MLGGQRRGLTIAALRRRTWCDQHQHRKVLKMVKARKGFGLGGKSGGGKRRKKKVTISKSGWGPQKTKTKEASDRMPVAPPTYDVQEIKIADIKVKGKRRTLSPAKVSELVQSISVLGLRDPITVRLVTKQIRWSRFTTEHILVDGLHRLEAMKQAGHTTIPCFIIEADKRGARMWEISSSLHRADLTPAEYDEQLAEWVRLFEESQPIGQNVQDQGRDRRKVSISEAVRRLPVKGKNLESKRKRVERALKSASVSPEAKEEAKKAGVDNSSNLRKIAAEKTVEDQLKLVHQLAAPKTATGDTTKTKTAVPTEPLSTKDKKILADIVNKCNDSLSLKRAYVNAPPNVREQFLTQIRIWTGLAKR
jgi:ParB-like chromosome segregation protein Spo0J